MAASRRVDFPALDGLRLLCFLPVFFFHCRALPGFDGGSAWQAAGGWLFRNGAVGVNFFFVLSGFLITCLLLNEKITTGHLAVGRFYLRRILRIWPLYFFMVALGFVLVLLAGSGAWRDPSSPYAYLLFYANFDYLQHPSAQPVLAILWSVAVEEQFYLVWPLLLLAVPGRRVPWLLGGVLLLALGFRAAHATDNWLLEHHTLAVIGDMAVGGMAAWLVVTRPGLPAAVAGWSRRRCLMLYALLAAVCLFRQELFARPELAVIERAVIAALAALVIVEQCYAARTPLRLTRWPRVAYWGRRTYGLYCFHTFGLLLAATLCGQSAGAAAGLGLLLTGALAATSYRWLEQPFLRGKERLAVIRRD